MQYIHALSMEKWPYSSSECCTNGSPSTDSIRGKVNLGLQDPQMTHLYCDMEIHKVVNIWRKD